MNVNSNSNSNESAELANNNNNSDRIGGEFNHNQTSTLNATPIRLSQLALTQLSFSTKQNQKYSADAKNEIIQIADDKSNEGSK